MATYALLYRMPAAAKPGDAATRAVWNAWFDGMGDHLLDRGNPIFQSQALGNCGTGTTPGGYSLVLADDLDMAVRLAKGCPALAAGAGVEVGGLTELNQGRRSIAGDPA